SLDPRCQFGIVVGRGAFQVQRVQQWLRPEPGDGVIDAVEPGKAAAKQDQGGTGGGARTGCSGAQAAVGTCNQDHAPGQRLRGGNRKIQQAHCDCASLTMRCNSPDSSNSRVISQPPISSPCRNSCGNVGQLE